MEKLKNYLNSIGLALMLISFISFIIWPHKKTVPVVLGILGITSIAVYIITHIPLLQQSLKRKSFFYSSNLLLMIIMVVAILVLINYVLARHHYRIDFTESKLHSLSDQSISVLKGLKEDVNIKCFYREGNFSRSEMENVLKIYSYHSKKMKYEFIDPDKNPGLVKRYEVAEDGTTIFESGDKESRITSSEEEDITNALIKISRDRKKIIYFLEGHGEAGIDETGDNGYSLAKNELGKMAYDIQKLSLALSDNFPEKISLLVIPGPEKDLLPNEIDTLRNFIHQGGRVLFMLDPRTVPGLIPFLEEFGIALENDLIIDRVSRLLGGDYFMPAVTQYEYHDITKNFRYATFFPYARSVDTTEKQPEGTTAKVLARSSVDSWSERQLDQMEASFDKEKDKAGPIPLAVVSEIKFSPSQKEEDQKDPEKEESSPEPEGRVVVFGDSDFINNSYFHFSGNGNLFLNAVNWLTEEGDLISIQPKTSSPRTIQLTPSQGRLVFFVSVIILPLAVLITGLSVWIRRRSL